MTLIHRTHQVGTCLLKSLTAALLLSGIAHANPPVNELPTGGQVSAGQASISQLGNTLNINQTSGRAAVNWNTFNIGSAGTVNFSQPNSSSVILNRVLSNNPSQIFGSIHANGQVFLTNPSGIYFAPGSSVNVGGLVATTHGITDEDFMAGRNSFNRNGATASVINEGDITAALNGYVALLAPEVRNHGVIVAQLGTVALAAGEAFELQFDGNDLLNTIRVTPSTIQALVENGNAVHAPGGLIILSAQAVNSLQGGGIINNSGTLEATGISSKGGRVILEASDTLTHTGTINVDAAQNSTGNGGSATLIANLANPNSLTDINGTISARGGDLGGDGGFVETSASRVKIGDNAKVDTQAPNGLTGKWLLDPVDFYIAASGGDITGTALGTALGLADVTIDTTGSSATCTTTGSISCGAGSGTNGDIYINDPVTWNTHMLTLTAAGGVTGSSALAITTAGTLTINQVGNSTYAGIISGSTGKLVKQGAGVLTLTAANTYTGITTVSGGTLQLGDGSVSGTGTIASTSSIAVASGALLKFNHPISGS